LRQKKPKKIFKDLHSKYEYQDATSLGDFVTQLGFSYTDEEGQCRVAQIAEEGLRRMA